MSEVTNNSFEEEQLVEPDQLKEIDQKERGKTFGKISKVLIALILGLGLATAAIAYTNPSLLEPIANVLPDGLLEKEVPPAKGIG